ncbi:MAG: tetratricopeptide repeat protein [Clostridia bacterium]|nr:tetratricopeptide repeat protein [Clostridia bacterium]
MKKLLLALVCIMMAFTLVGCQKNEEETLTDSNYKITIVIEGGHEKKMEMDAKKTPLIHEANELLYLGDYSGAVAGYSYALANGEFDPIVYHKLGYLFMNGLGVEKDVDRALEFYNKGVAFSQLGCLYNLGIYCVNSGDYVKAKEYFEKAIETGLPLGYYGLGYLYALDVEGVEKDLDKAYELFDKAVESNDLEAMYSAGKFLNVAGETDELKAKGLDILIQASDAGYSEACFCVGEAYEAGRGAEVDTKKAFEYYLKGAEMNSTTTYYDNVGYCYEEGVGVEQDYAKAVECYELATESNSGMAWYDLGRMYENGLGVEKDLGKALECYMYADRYKQDCPFATAKLQELLSNIK